MGKSKYCWRRTMDSVQSNESMVVVARRSLGLTLYYGKNCDLEWFQIKSRNFKSNPNQITCFPNQIIILQVKSLCVIQSWFKSNHDLDLPITGSLLCYLEQLWMTAVCIRVWCFWCDELVSVFQTLAVSVTLIASKQFASRFKWTWKTTWTIVSMRLEVASVNCCWHSHVYRASRGSLSSKSNWPRTTVWSSLTICCKRCCLLVMCLTSSCDDFVHCCFSLCCVALATDLCVVSSVTFPFVRSRISVLRCKSTQDLLSSVRIP